MTDPLAKVRTLVTLAVLAVLLLIGVTWGWSAATSPFPQEEAAPLCSDTPVAQGDKVYPDAVTVSVSNAGGTEGLAGRTMGQLVELGFAEGEKGNIDGSDKEIRGVQIWTDAKRNPAVRLVVSYLGKNVKVLIKDGVRPGVNVIVGEGFQAPTKGAKWAVAQTNTSICSPTTTDTDG